MKLWRAVVAGLVGCVVVIAAMTIAGAMSGTDADLCALTGAVITGRTGAMSWLSLPMKARLPMRVGNLLKPS